MRAAIYVLLGFLGLGACSPDIASGTYYCGPEELCPEGQVCNGTDNICTIPANVQPFTCDFPDRTGDDVPAQGLPLAGLTCVSGVRELHACLVDGDPGDWFQFDVPDNCNGVQIEARLTFAVAYEPVGIQLATEDGPGIDVETPCTVGVQDAGLDVRCFKQVVTNGSHHAIGLVHTNTADCDGACAHNRYTLDFQLSAP